MPEPYRDWKRKRLEYAHPMEALKGLLEHSRLRPRVTQLPVTRAIGFRLAEDVKAPSDRPAHDLSHVDGYAIRSSDSGGGGCLKRVEGVDPRAAHSYELSPGEAVYVDTGFPLPRGADAVVPVEDALVEEGGMCVKVPRVTRGENVIPRGIEYREGQLLARRGERLTGAHARVLLDAGIPGVRVYEPARVALIPVGDELSPPPEREGEARPEGVVWESSTIMVRSLLSHLPTVVDVEGIVGDSPEDIVETVKRAVSRGYDIVATIGGVSLGRKDQTWLALREALSPNYYYRGVRVVQGRVNSGMALGGAVLLNLPGFVQSTFTGTVLFLAPLASWASGGPLAPLYPCWEARLAERLDLGGSRREFYKMRFVHPRPGEDGGEVVVQARVESSMALPLVSSLGFTVIPPGVEVLERGAKIIVFDHLWRRGRVDCSLHPLEAALLSGEGF